jgi:hypothetical protein
MGSRDISNGKKGAKAIVHLFIIGKGVNGVTRIY